MLLNSLNSKPSSYDETDIVTLIGFKRYAEAYSLLEKSKIDTISHHYNMAICLYKGEIYDKALLAIDKALSLIDRKMSNLGKLNKEVSELLINQAHEDTHLMPIAARHAELLEFFTKQNAIRIKIDCLDRLDKWEEVLKLAKQLDGYSYANVIVATMVAERNLKNGKL